MKNRTNPKPEGATLLNLFQQAFVTAATVQAAKYEAEGSEHAVLSALDVQAGGNLLMPESIPVDARDAMTRASVDAHIKKIQAQQMEQMESAQVSQLQQQAQSDFKNVKVLVRVIASAEKPVEAIWFDQHQGYRSSPTTKRKLKGYISEVLLDKNLLIVLPKASARLVTPNLTGYAIHVIDPVSFQPMVDVITR